MQSASSRRRQRNQTNQINLPTELRDEGPMPTEDADDATKPKMNIRLQSPNYFVLGKVIIVSDAMNIDISVRAPVVVLQNFFNHVKTDETLQRMWISNQEGNRAGQHIVDALLDAAVSSDAIEQVAIEKCQVGLEALCSAVSTMRSISLVDCRCAADLTVEKDRKALVDRWMSNSRLEKLRVQRTFDTEFLGALLEPLHTLSALKSVEIGITNATAARHLADFLSACKHKRRINIILNDWRLDDATVSELLRGLSDTNFAVMLHLNRCCWKALPATTSEDVKNLYFDLVEGLKPIKRMTYRRFSEFKETWLQDVASEYGHVHTNMPPFDAELERGHNEAAIVPATAKPAASAQHKPKGKNKGKNKKKK